MNDKNIDSQWESTLLYRAWAFKAANGKIIIITLSCVVVDTDIVIVIVNILGSLTQSLASEIKKKLLLQLLLASGWWYALFSRLEQNLVTYVSDLLAM